MKLVRFAAAAALAVLSATAVSAQNAPYLAPQARTYASAPGAVLAPPGGSRADTIAAFLGARGNGVAAGSLIEAGASQALNNVTIVRFEQRVAGLLVYDVYAKAAFTASGELVHLIENLVPVSTVVPGGVTAAQALGAALRAQYGAAVAVPPQARIEGNTVVFERTAFFHKAPTATRVAVQDADGSLRAATLVETWSQRGNLLHHTLVGAGGDVLAVELRTNTDTYNVFTVDPDSSVQTEVTGGNWLGAGSQTTVNISGPNVHAYLDADANNSPDAGGTAVSNGQFDAAWDGSAAPDTAANKNVAVQNLFYLNNVMHDVLESHGFDNAAGNFEGSDPVNAEAQDGSGTDNANFATPSDGSSPRMQMFLWSDPTPDKEVAVSGNSYYGKGAEFGPALTTTGISGTLALPSVADGCTKLASLSGKVAVIDRGTCTFKKKVANAQAAGAIGVIIANNQGDGVFVMGDDTKVRTRIVIPSIMVGQNDGGTLKTKVASQATMRDRNITLLMTDASLDSDVVYHEYGHGLTWRMIGGMSGPIAGAIGEGASDGVALLMNEGDVIGEYSAGVDTGIRRYRYAGYPLTYGDVTGAEVHDDGEIFAAIVYDLKERFAAAGVPAQTLFDYYVDGMNYTPATPAFEDMRDGMLASADAAGGAHSCLIWRSFARFGVGVGADGVVLRRGGVSITQSVVLPAACQP